MDNLDIQIVDSLTVDINQVNYITNAETQNNIDVFIEDQEQFESFIDTQDTSVLYTEESSKYAIIDTLDKKQDKEDSSLETSSNVIVGAINEVNTKLKQHIVEYNSLGELVLSNESLIKAIKVENEQLKLENEELRNKLKEVENLTYAGL